jgi:HPt (histidine-containing phosphotransfer) domain-containing protein
LQEPKKLRRLLGENKAKAGRYVKRSLNHLCGWLIAPATFGRAKQDASTSHMAFHAQRIEWMPSPPLAPDDGPIDLAHLARMTLGDAGLERQVLVMFAGQAAGLVGKLALLPAEAGALAHMLSGSARAVGAFRVAECAEALEVAIKRGENPAKSLAELKAAVKDARAAIDTMLGS